MQNNNGLLIDDHGMLCGIDVTISDCKVSGLPRRAYLKSFSILGNFQMEQIVGTRFYTADGTQPIQEHIKETISDARLLNQELDKWRDGQATFITEGAFVDPKTGSFVEADTTGAVPQVAAMQSLTPAKLRAMGLPINQNGSTPVLMMIYLMLLAEIQKQDGLGRL